MGMSEKPKRKEKKKRQYTPEYKNEADHRGNFFFIKVLLLCPPCFYGICPLMSYTFI
jgi:hypothetical protein